MTWETLTTGKSFITDLMQFGDLKSLEGNRFAVWKPNLDDNAKHHIVELGCDIESLMEKYQIEREYVFCIAGGIGHE